MARGQMEKIEMHVFAALGIVVLVASIGLPILNAVDGVVSKRSDNVQGVFWLGVCVLSAGFLFWSLFLR
jgi:hypothetical protein